MERTFLVVGFVCNSLLEWTLRNPNQFYFSDHKGSDSKCGRTVEDETTQRYLHQSGHPAIGPWEEQG